MSRSGNEYHHRHPYRYICFVSQSKIRECREGISLIWHRTEVTTETATVTVQTVNLVGVSVVSNVSTPLTTSPAPTTLVMSTVQANGTALNTTMPSSTTVVVVPPLSGSPLSYASPTGCGQPLTGDDGDGDNGYGSSSSNGGEEGSSEAGSGSYWDGGEDEGDASDNAGDVETGPWDLGSGSDSEDSGSESEEHSGRSSFLDWLLEILK
jgi:hypothetical protein